VNTVNEKGKGSLIHTGDPGSLLGKSILTPLHSQGTAQVQNCHPPARKKKKKKKKKKKRKKKTLPLPSRRPPEPSKIPDPKSAEEKKNQTCNQQKGKARETLSGNTRRKRRPFAIS